MQAAEECAFMAQSLDSAPWGPSQPVFCATQVSAEWVHTPPLQHAEAPCSCPAPPPLTLPRVAPAGLASRLPRERALGNQKRPFYQLPTCLPSPRVCFWEDQGPWATHTGLVNWSSWAPCLLGRP